MTARNPAQASTLAGGRVQPDGPLSGAVKREGAPYTVKPKKGEPRCYCYVVNHGGDVVKIGHSRDPDKRLSDMRVGSPVTMRLYHSWRLTTPGAQALERRLHQLFKPEHSHGEWFEVFPTDVVSVGNVLLSGREGAAERLVVLLRLITDKLRERRNVNDHWPSGRGSFVEKQAMRKAARARIPIIEQEHAALMVEALDLGLRPTRDDLDYEDVGGALSYYRAVAEGREWVRKTTYFGRKAEPYPDNAPRLFDPADHLPMQTVRTSQGEDDLAAWEAAHP